MMGTCRLRNEAHIRIGIDTRFSRVSAAASMTCLHNEILRRERCEPGWLARNVRRSPGSWKDMQSNGTADPGENSGEVQDSTRPGELDLDLDDFAEPLGGRSVEQEDLNLIELPDVGTQSRNRLPGEVATAGTCLEDTSRPAPATPEWSTRADRLTATITQFTGWTVSLESDGDRSVRFPVFSDGERAYRFDEWKILISFHRIPGVALLNWSPESLEDDLKRAKEIRPESCSVQRVARHLLEHLSPAQIKELMTALANEYA